MNSNKPLGFFLNLKRKLLCYFFYILELLALQNTLIYRFYFKWIGDIFIDEVTQAKITSQETVLHIGCGSLPVISLLVAQQAHAHVTAIDNNHNAIRQAQHYIEKKKLTEYITIQYGDGTQYPVETFDVIFIAINVIPVEDVFRHLARHAKPHARIICRDLGEGIIQLLNKKEFNTIFKIKNIRKKATTTSIFIIKKDSIPY